MRGTTSEGARTLACWVREGRRFTEREVVRIALEVTRLLVRPHQSRPPVVHCEVQPRNVVLGGEGEVSLLDAGAAVAGNRGYVPPEQARGHPVPASDVYALGMTIVFLLSHKEPHEIDTVNGRMVLGPHLRVSRPLRRVIRGMIAQQPEDRYPSAVELCADLERLAAQGAVVPSVLRRRAFAAAGAAVAGAILVLVIGWPARLRAPRAPAATPLPAPAKVPPPRPHVQVLGNTVRGRLTWDGKPLEALTDQPPRFWLRREAAGEVQGGTVTYDRGAFTIAALPTGTIGMQTIVNLNPSNANAYPGDLYAWTTFEAGRNDRPVTVELSKVIRLRAPQDNEYPLPGWGADCPRMFTTGSPVTFEWDAPAEGLTYHYSVRRIDCPYANQRTVLDASTTDLRVSVPLPPSGPNEFYLLDLSGSRGAGPRVGTLITHGQGGMGWDYRFRVR